VLETLSGRFADIVRKISGRGRIDEKAIEETAREIRLALLEADVNYKVVKTFISGIKEKALGEEVLKSLTPGQQVVKIVHDELALVMGGAPVELKLSGAKPDVVMLVGLQGSGKTTATAKLALRYKKQGLKTMMIAADTYRPAAQDQLKALGSELDIEVWAGDPGQNPVEIARGAAKHATKSVYDLLVLDTAGRLHVDEDLMGELNTIKRAIQPRHILFVADAMIGQDAVNQATAFNETVDFEGVILTKLDGDARGGAALSIRQVTGKPVMFVSTGEKPKDFDVFYPERMASRILGMGDVLSLVEKAEAAVDKEEAVKTAEKLLKEQFTLDDFLVELDRVSAMGGLNDMMDMLPKNLMPKGMRGANVDENDLKKTKALIQSMTAAERANPKIINGSRRARIARGSGTNVSDVNALIKQFDMMKKMVKSLKGGRPGRFNPGFSMFK
jgi:signal recognition particle subunit SRP54